MAHVSLATADALAEQAHRGQVDKAGDPYIAHPRAVAAMLAPYGENAQMAGVLHDVVEDTGITLDDLLAAGYPEEVVSAVDSVTRRDNETYMDMIRRAAAHPLGRRVKLADNQHNTDRLHNLDEPVRSGMARRYERARRILLAAQALAERDLAERDLATGEGDRITDDDIGWYYDTYIAHQVDDLPQDGRDHLRARYIEGVRTNPVAAAGVATALHLHRTGQTGGE